MNQKFRWFFIGLITAIIGVNTWGWLRNRPGNAVREFPKETQEFMLNLMPWLASARGAKLGPFTISVPSRSVETPEAIIWAHNEGFPQLLLVKNQISFTDSKFRIISVKFKEKSGEFESFNMADMRNGTTYVDNNFDGKYDVKLIMSKMGKLPEICIQYDSKWFPVLFKEKRKYIEVSGDLKEIRMENFVWEFAD